MAITPYPQAAAGWGPLFFVGSPLGRSEYHALQLTANKQFARRVDGRGSYTLSRQRGNMDSVFQERWSKGPIQDVTQLDQRGRRHRRRRSDARREGIRRVVAAVRRGPAIPELDARH